MTNLKNQQIDCCAGHLAGQKVGPTDQCGWQVFTWERFAIREAILLKKAEFYETFSQMGGAGQPDFISLIQKCYAPKKARKI